MALVKYIREKGISSTMWKCPIILLLLFALVATPVLAANTTILFNDLDLITHKDLEIYGLNDTSGKYELLGTYNSTSQLDFEPGTYTIVLRPSAIARFSNPVTWWSDFSSFFETNFNFIVAFFFFLAVVVYIARRR
jgi:hypothetical protein